MHSIVHHFRLNNSRYFHSGNMAMALGEIFLNKKVRNPWEAHIRYPKNCFSGSDEQVKECQLISKLNTCLYYCCARNDWMKTIKKKIRNYSVILKESFLVFFNDSTRIHFKTKNMVGSGLPLNNKVGYHPAVSQNENEKNENSLQISYS